jgi:hypothetical protein
MSDPTVNEWRQRSALYLWRNPDNTRNYPGWDCAVDDSARRSMIELCERMLAAQFPARRTLVISPLARNVAEWPGAPVTGRFFAPFKLTIEFPLDAVTAEHWRWSGDPNQPVLTLGRAKLMDLKRAFEQLEHYGDFCIHADDQKLHGYEFEKSSIWFWEWFKPRGVVPRHLPRNG